MKDEDIYAGQLVTIRQWKDMATEFAELKYLSGTMINVLFTFTQRMKPLCGLIGRVTGIDRAGGRVYLCGIKKINANSPAISAGMLSPYVFENQR